MKQVIRTESVPVTVKDLIGALSGLPQNTPVNVWAITSEGLSNHFVLTGQIDYTDFDNEVSLWAERENYDEAEDAR